MNPVTEGDLSIAELPEKESRIRKAVDRTCDFFLRTQYPEGY